MFKLRDFFPMPQVSNLVNDVISSGPGLTVVAGLDFRLGSSSTAGIEVLPSGRSAIFRALVDELFVANQSGKIFIITSDKAFLPVSRRDERRIGRLIVDGPITYEQRITEAIKRHPKVLVLDHIQNEALPSVLAAVNHGIQVFSQADTVLRGASAAHWLLRDVESPDQAAALAWILSVQRVATLCQECRQEARPTAAHLEALRNLLSHLGDQNFADVSAAPYYQAGKCATCNQTGRQGDAGVIDVYHSQSNLSMLPVEGCLLHLAIHGRLSLDDVFGYDEDRLHRMARLVETVELTLQSRSADVNRKDIELEAAQRVLTHRTQALFSIEEFSQTLITSTDLNDLGNKVCRRACDLCGADRAILYFLSMEKQVAVLAVAGWPADKVQKYLPVEDVFLWNAPSHPIAYHRVPPGIPAEAVEGKKNELRAGLSVPLMAQERQVGLLLVNSTRKLLFAPGEVALLQTFANQAAMALQRAGLIEQLQSKITQLEAAQVELAHKERLEREFELARQVQQSMLPLTFPEVSGYLFFALNQPARQVGGDFYDVIALDNDHFGIVVADVSDKGMPAALYMALTRSLLHAEARRDLSPRAVLARVNHLLLELGDQPMFVTVFYGVMDMATRMFSYARAGHDRPLLMREGQTQELTGKGIALGVLGTGEFYLTEENVSLACNDRLVLFTDGLTDVITQNEEPFGLYRLKELFQKHAGLAAHEYCQAVFSDLASYHGMSEPFDDMTLLVMDVLPD
jgi:serine phosphatase RsbU (regulator of sigma subunit)